MKSNLITVQETHFRKKGKFQIPNFIIFESIRAKKGGGTLIAAHKDLNPKLIEEYSEEFELLVIEVSTVRRSQSHRKKATKQESGNLVHHWNKSSR